MVAQLCKYIKTITLYTLEVYMNYISVKLLLTKNKLVWNPGESAPRKDKCLVFSNNFFSPTWFLRKALDGLEVLEIHHTSANVCLSSLRGLCGPGPHVPCHPYEQTHRADNL